MKKDYECPDIFVMSFSTGGVLMSSSILLVDRESDVKFENLELGGDFNW